MLKKKEQKIICDNVTARRWILMKLKELKSKFV